MRLAHDPGRDRVPRLNPKWQWVEYWKQALIKRALRNAIASRRCECGTFNHTGVSISCYSWRNGSEAGLGPSTASGRCRTGKSGCGRRRDLNRCGECSGGRGYNRGVGFAPRGSTITFSSSVSACLCERRRDWITKSEWTWTEAYGRITSGMLAGRGTHNGCFATRFRLLKAMIVGTRLTAL